MIFPENKKLLTATNWSLVCIPEAATVWQRWCGGGIGDLGNNQQWDAGVPGDCWAFRHIFWLCLTSGICLEFYFWNNQQWDNQLLLGLQSKKLAVSVLHLEQPTVRGELPRPFVFWI